LAKVGDVAAHLFLEHFQEIDCIGLFIAATCDKVLRTLIYARERKCFWKNISESKI